MAQKVKNPPGMQKTQVWSLGQEDALEMEMANFNWTMPTMKWDDFNICKIFFTQTDSEITLYIIIFMHVI